KEVVQATPETNLQQVAALMNQNHVGCIPICQEEQVVGLVTDRDIVTRAVASSLDCSSTKVSDIMNTKIIKTTPDTDIDEALETMKKNQIRRLPVIEDNKIVGILSMGDIAVTLDEEETGEAFSCICDDDDGEKHCD
ncbi:MAG: CBS domain-containing protein, partial [Clostridia bacterium]|nr:CBS domain-containing protein [Clostridia bacterium]